MCAGVGRRVVQHHDLRRDERAVIAVGDGQDPQDRDNHIKSGHGGILASKGPGPRQNCHLRAMMTDAAGGLPRDRETGLTMTTRGIRLVVTAALVVLAALAINNSTQISAQGTASNCRRHRPLRLIRAAKPIW